MIHLQWLISIVAAFHLPTTSKTVFYYDDMKDKVNTSQQVTCTICFPPSRTMIKILNNRLSAKKVHCFFLKAQLWFH